MIAVFVIPNMFLKIISLGLTISFFNFNLSKKNLPKFFESESIIFRLPTEISKSNNVLQCNSIALEEISSS